MKTINAIIANILNTYRNTINNGGICTSYMVKSIMDTTMPDVVDNSWTLQEFFIRTEKIQSIEEAKKALLALEDYCEKLGLIYSTHLDISILADNYSEKEEIFLSDKEDFYEYTKDIPEYAGCTSKNLLEFVDFLQKKYNYSLQEALKHALHAKHYSERWGWTVDY